MLAQQCKQVSNFVEMEKDGGSSGQPELCM